MKTRYLVIAAMMMLLSMPAFAQEENRTNDSIAKFVKIKELKIKKDNLIKQIKMEDAKRDMSIDGVTFESQERLNDIQDSICLDLRSQLVSIELEIKELSPNDVAGAINKHMNKLNANSQPINKKEE